MNADSDRLTDDTRDTMRNERGISAADARKPDPDEPYRYVCPDCGGQVHGDTGTKRYECHACSAWVGFADLFDKKAGTTVRLRRGWLDD